MVEWLAVVRQEEEYDHAELHQFQRNFYMGSILHPIDKSGISQEDVI